MKAFPGPERGGPAKCIGTTAGSIPWVVHGRSKLNNLERKGGSRASHLVVPELRRHSTGSGSCETTRMRGKAAKRLGTIPTAISLTSRVETPVNCRIQW